MKSSLNCFYAVGRHGRQYLVSGVVALSVFNFGLYLVFVNVKEEERGSCSSSSSGSSEVVCHRGTKEKAVFGFL